VVVELISKLFRGAYGSQVSIDDLIPAMECARATYVSFGAKD